MPMLGEGHCKNPSSRPHLLTERQAACQSAGSAVHAIAPGRKAQNRRATARAGYDAAKITKLWQLLLELEI
ncbi:MAG: hypothetical protein M3R31_01660 [Pseudomonadota bacterium]|nr:hypothetical protein [Pseudomonadota bacterium]